MSNEQGCNYLLLITGLFCLKASPKLTVVEDFPTPPLADEMTTMFLTPAKPNFVANRRHSRVFGYLSAMNISFLSYKTYRKIFGRE